MDILILIMAFFFFASYNQEFVDKYLFLVMTLYLLVNKLFYEEKEKLTLSFFKNNILELILLFIIILIPLFTYFIKHNLVLAYKMIFIALFFEYFLILIVRKITQWIKKIRN